VTTALEHARRNGRAVGHANDVVLTPPASQRDDNRRESWFARHPAWPISAMLMGWPLWWILGFSVYTPVLLGIPVAVTMYKWRASGRREIRVPPGFGIWVLFLIVTALGVAAINLTAPGTTASPVSNRVISWALRLLTYLAVTLYMLYAGNLTEKELPRRRLAWLLGLLGIYTVVGGLAATFFHNKQFTSPLALIVPRSLTASNFQLAQMLHPSLSQVQNFLGYAEGRPSAPFTYTNMWGNALAILLPWLMVAWYAYGSRRERRIAGITLFLAVIPVVYSLDRGLWVGIGISVLYLAIRFAVRGRVALLGAIFGAIVLAVILIVATPLQTLIKDRLSHGKSNTGRTSHSLIAFTDALASPVLGFGDTRHEQGSGASITLGKSANCPKCAASVIGGDGQLQLLLISSGLLGTAFYIAFFCYGIWRYRRDGTPYGVAGIMVLLVGLWLMFVYVAEGPPLTFTMLAYALLWRNDQARRREAAAPAEQNGRALAAGVPRRAIGAGTRA
jgi:hypothetical protein